MFAAKVKGSLQVTFLDARGVGMQGCPLHISLQLRNPTLSASQTLPSETVSLLKLRQEHALQLTGLDFKELYVQLFAQRTFKKNKFLGQFAVRVSVLNVPGEAQWYLLQDRARRSGRPRKHVIAGEVLIKLICEPSTPVSEFADNIIPTVSKASGHSFLGSLRLKRKVPASPDKFSTLGPSSNGYAANERASVQGLPYQKKITKATTSPNLPTLSRTEEGNSGCYSVFEVLFDDLKDLKLLASGGRTKMYSAKYRGEHVAVKMLSSFSITPEALKAFKQEVITCITIRSRFVVNFLGACTEENHLALVTELMSAGSLSTLLRSQNELPWALRLRMLEEIARGVNVLHSNKPAILHRDLNSENILLDEDGHCKLANFGFAMVKEHSASKSELSVTGTFNWIAPELLSLKPNFSTKSDIYAFGTLMWEIAAQLTPNCGANPAVIRATEGQRDEILFGCPEGYADLMRQCWDHVPANRPSIDSVVDTISRIKRAYTNKE